MHKQMRESLLICVVAVTVLTSCLQRVSPTVETPTSRPAPTGVSIPTATAVQALPTATRAAAIVPTSAPEPTPEPVINQPIALFAGYNLEAVLAKPALVQEAIDPQMGNVLVPLVLSDEQIRRLAEAGIVASPRDYEEFHELYLESVRGNLPVFVTSDALLHAYHLTFDTLLSALEEQVFLPKLRLLNQALLEQAEMQMAALKGTAWEEAALRLYAYLSVGSRLADPSFSLPAEVSELAQAEIDLIEAAAGPAPSPIFKHLKYGEDYSQYAPRGHYMKSDALKTYFKSMMWYGRMTFRLSDPEDAQAGPAETRMALLLALAVRDGSALGQPALKLWELIYDPTAFLIGRSDDLTLTDYLQVMDAVYGPEADLQAVARDGRLPDFISAAGELPAPRILGLLSDDYKPLDAVKGLRLVGQRFVVDAYVFQELIHPKVDKRYLPSGLDVMAVFGSERAAFWLKQDPSMQRSDYQAQFNQLTTWANSLTQDEWVETAYSGWLYTLRPLLEPPGQGYPLFMQSTAWQDKQLNSALGSWAELKHDTLLYAKQPYGGIGGCGWPNPPAPVLARNYVEPVPEVYARIAALAQMTRDGLEERGLIDLIPKENTYDRSFGDHLDQLARQALDMKAIAERELQGLPLLEHQEAALRSFGEYMQQVVIWANGGKEDLDPAAVIADVATDPNKGEVLEVGIGGVHEFYVAAPIAQADGSLALTVARGGIFSYYEFASPERLTDETWRARVKAGETPAQPAFTSSFSVPQAASPDIQAVIYRFQQDWAEHQYWTTGYNGSAGCAKAPEFHMPVSERVMEQATVAVAELAADTRYEGRQWISTDYLKVEVPENARSNRVVTVRETWSDFLVDYTGSDAFFWYDASLTEPVTARRGPYSVDVVYELEPVESVCPVTFPEISCMKWRVVRFEELTERPGWIEQ